MPIFFNSVGSIGSERRLASSDKTPVVTVELNIGPTGL